MPIYEYKCDSCEDVFEELLLGSEPDPDTCPRCGAESVRRVISNTSFQLKGGGWYVTDYKSPSGPSASDATETSADEGASTDSADASGSSDSPGASDSSGASASDGGSSSKENSGSKSGGSDDSSAA